MAPRHSTQSEIDPFQGALRPPANETPAEREQRERTQALAREVSRAIDERILEDKKLLDKKKEAVKVLLLGQAESGKSTTLKNFQLEFCPSQLRNQYNVWKTVIQLNVIRSVKTLLDVIARQLDPNAPPAAGGPVSGRPTPRAKVPTRSSRLTDAHRHLRMRLSPLLAIEETLTRRLGTAFPDGSGGAHAPVKDLTVRAGSGWQRVLANLTNGSDQRSASSSASDRHRDDPTGVLTACRGDIMALWHDDVLRAVLREEGIRLENSPGFFLNDIERIATWEYKPTDDDILRARVRTLGVEEHFFKLESASVDLRKDWYIYDVGGSRTARDKWAPFFDDVDAIIFLAPLVFDQYLEEAPNVNRLKDTIEIWKHVCGNKLLQRATLVLFLNKMDVLERTLIDGVRVKDYIPAYEGANELAPVVAYFRDIFTKLHKKHTSREARARDVFVHETSVIDARATRNLLGAVRLGVLTANLERVALM